MTAPVDDFLRSLTVKQFEKVTWVLKIFRELPFIPKQYFKKLVGTKDIWEVRIDSGSDTFRLLGFLDKGNFVLLTNGFAKKTAKTPSNEISIAEQRKKDYETRRNG
ncbi:MAG: type II toxin-antitoxin system RelE/ParE family toxin [Acidobacteriota bacterium]